MENIKHFVDINYTNEEVEQVEINAKYEGYIKKLIKKQTKCYH